MGDGHSIAVAPAESPQAGLFTDAIRGFADTLSGLRDFVDVIGPLLDEHGRRATQSCVKNLAPLLLALRKMRADDAIPEFISPEWDEASLEDLVNRTYRGQLAIDVDPEGHSARIQIRGEDGRAFVDAMKTLERPYRRKELLYMSSLISLLSAAEWFISQVLHRYYDRCPDAVGLQEKMFSLEDLRSFASVQDATSFLVDHRVESVLRGSLEDWYKFFKEKLKLSMGYLDDDLALLGEAYQRRNLLVHNGGRVNTIYLSKVAAGQQKGLVLGQPVTVLPDYLDRAISRFETGFMLIAAELWKKLAPNDEERAGTLIDIAFQHLCEERWDVAEGLSRFTMNDKLMSENRRLKAAVNYWQSIKWQGRFEEVREEVVKADFSAKEPLFVLVKHALLDDNKAFFELLPRVIKGGSLTEDALDMWPIFRQVRSSEEYAALKQARHKKASRKPRSSAVALRPTQPDGSPMVN